MFLTIQFILFRKIAKMKLNLSKRYKTSKIVSAALSARYSNRNLVKFIKEPLKKKHIYGYSDFFKIFNVRLIYGFEII